MKGVTGGFLAGLIVGVVGTLVAVKIKNGELSLDFDALGDKIHDNLEELEARLTAITSEAEPTA